MFSFFKKNKSSDMESVNIQKLKAQRDAEIARDSIKDYWERENKFRNTMDKMLLEQRSEKPDPIEEEIVDRICEEIETLNYTETNSNSFFILHKSGTSIDFRFTGNLVIPWEVMISQEDQNCPTKKLIITNYELTKKLRNTTFSSSENAKIKHKHEILNKLKEG